MSKRKFYEIEQDDDKASSTSNRVTKRAKLMNSSDSKFKNMKKTKRYIDKLTDLNAKRMSSKKRTRTPFLMSKNVRQFLKIKKKEQPKQQIKTFLKILRRKKSIQSLNDLKKR